MTPNYDVIIVGGGISGLATAIELEKFNLKVLVLEKTDRVGGRVKTDNVDGFLLDHGFQVYLTAYPDASSILDYNALNLKSFYSGALCFNGDEKFTVSDTTRYKLATAKMAFSPVGGLMDKVRLGNLAARLKKTSLESIFIKPDLETLSYLKQLGFSDKIIQRFFKPFYGGIFLDNHLETSSRMFEFVFKMFAEGDAALPAGGIEEIPRQLKSKLKSTEFKFHTEVESIDKGLIKLKGGEQMQADHIVLATNDDSIINQVDSHQQWHNTATYYFAADKSVLHKNIIALNYSEHPLVNNFTVISDAAKTYAPKGKHLISVSLKDVPQKSVEEVSRAIKNELALTFGSDVQGWQFLRNYHIAKALPVIHDVKNEIPFTETKLKDGLYLAGDYLLNGSINGAIKSGQLAAQAVILNYNTNTHESIGPHTTPYV
jgi:phytoene dehydrogenase-like protein